MITAPENNIKLTDEQTAAIEEAQSRLLILESQINVQTKNLRTLKIDTDNVTKDRLLLEEEIKKLNDQVSPLKVTIDSLNRQIDEKISELASVTQKIAVKSDELTSKETSLKIREDSIAAKEDELNAREIILSNSEELYEESKQKLEARITRINEAINV